MGEVEPWGGVEIHGRDEAGAGYRQDEDDDRAWQRLKENVREAGEESRRAEDRR